jgi:hypothetical protein
MSPRDPDDRVSRARRLRIVDRYETGVALLVAAWTTAFVVRSKLAESGRLTDVGNEALLSLLFVVPVMLLGWGALALADRRYKLGLFRSRDRS